MEKITFVIPSRNNLEFLQLAYQSIRNLDTKHEILVLNDASTDGTQEWISNQQDEDLIVYHNPGPERIGIVGMFDKGIEMARTDIIMAFHADMVACKDFDVNILKHLEKGKIVTGTRVEPPLHPDGPEKILRNFGIEVDEFNMPVAQQSGSVDQGHLSELPEKLISQQAGRLNTALEGYYSQTTNHVQLSNELDDLGYTPERRNEILEDAQEERT